MHTHTYACIDTYAYALIYIYIYGYDAHVGKWPSALLADWLSGMQNMVCQTDIDNFVEIHMNLSSQLCTQITLLPFLLEFCCCCFLPNRLLLLLLLLLLFRRNRVARVLRLLEKLCTVFGLLRYVTTNKHVIKVFARPPSFSFFGRRSRSYTYIRTHTHIPRNIHV